jgi:hypothetical protein
MATQQFEIHILKTPFSSEIHQLHGGIHDIFNIFADLLLYFDSAGSFVNRLR